MAPGTTTIVETPIHMPTEAEFDDYIGKLRQHDWYWDYSQGQTYQRGKANAQYLERKASEHPIYQEAYDAWHARVFRDHKAVNYLDASQVCTQKLKALRQQIIEAITIA